MIAEILHRLFIAREGTSLRKEDLQKVRELEGMMGALGKLRRGAHLVDAAAGKSSVGLIAAELLPIGSLTVIERDPKRVAACRDAATRLSRMVPVEVREADVNDAAAWPHAPDAVVALHACGRASDLVLDRAIDAETRFLFLVPCCYGADVPFMSQALAMADAMGMADHPAVRRRIACSLVDTERVLRLEAAGYETETIDFVGATVTPHNLLLRSRRTHAKSRMERARAKLDALRKASEGGR
ncbi:MAG: methyltransferase [Polyangiales bacterium]